MSDAIYKTVDLVGSSTESVEDAVQGAISKASETINNLGWFEVKEIRGHITDGKVAHYQVGLKVGFRLE